MESETLEMAGHQYRTVLQTAGDDLVTVPPGDSVHHVVEPFGVVLGKAEHNV